jgi:hypothetical protein
MAQFPQQTNPTPGQNSPPDVKSGAQPTDAERKAQADKAKSEEGLTAKKDQPEEGSPE